ncbi:monofunctional biosynthetic peptidoglycan transglycosylase [Primorskyibacter aestuariivivens]|uniref:monofunctional biosynthetic peptidoglycan transglycosylase n=1 Tax=Primorskyibacter aestuariivivens TaxID=1888912 RepID=UPI0023008E39|nr:monofunctional biosynthetic peptidoglycan transglycosylase [Primorskyibacter aestuariivivens]MDA7429519.1 monofunctional biosynthetic peptidoglycan transglycosylase [Primorskyibacter aestuariivivens]
MARKTTDEKLKKIRGLKPKPRPKLGRWVRRQLLRVVSVAFLLAAFAVILFAVFNPPKTYYMRQEAARLGGIDHVWVRMEHIAPVMARSAVAAEDANFCQHWGFDMGAIRAALAEGGQRGASTISQQVVKNVYLWQGRSWSRKALEALITPVMEAVWSKRRILEVYLNVAEFDEGVFGVEAAARHYFGVGPGELTAVQAARLAAVLPNPKGRSASRPSPALRSRAGQIRDGAATIDRDGRAACFQ